MSDGCAAFQPHPSNPIPTPELLEDLRAGPALEITTEKEQVLGGEGRGHWRKPALFTRTDKAPLVSEAAR